MVSYLRRNPSLIVGIVLISAVLLFAIVGRLVWDVSLASPLKVRPNQPPSWEHPFGTDRQGRDLFAVMILATPASIYVGLFAGFMGLAIGTALALVAAYYGGRTDTIIRGIVDVGLTLPPLLVLIMVAISVRASLSVSQMALVVGSLSWLYPTRTIRSQVLTIKERAYIQVARLSGASTGRIIFFEIMPNLLPYLAATFVGAVSAAILAAIGLEALGLGPIEANTLGVTLYWANFNNALLLGRWWWFMPPVVIIVLLFVGLFSIAAGLDEFANPRKRRSI